MIVNPKSHDLSPKEEEEAPKQNLSKYTHLRCHREDHNKFKAIAKERGCSIMGLLQEMAEQATVINREYNRIMREGK